MRFNDRLRSRIEMLVFQSPPLIQWNGWTDTPEGMESSGRCQGWLASAMNAIEAASNSRWGAHKTRADNVLLQPDLRERVAAIAAILRALLEDVDAGVFSTIADGARAEVFDEMLDQAEHYLSGGKIAPAGVIAGVVFEDTIRRAADKQQIPQKGASLDALISELARRGLLTDVKAKRARSAAGVRTKATHAQWDEFDQNDVSQTIGTTREMIDNLIDSWRTGFATRTHRRSYTCRTIRSLLCGVASVTSASPRAILSLTPFGRQSCRLRGVKATLRFAAS
jgi:hypothetical protein